MADLIRHGKQAWPGGGRRRALLVYYSGSFATDRLAKQIAARTGFDIDIDVIEDERPATGLRRYLRSRLASVAKWLPPIRSAVSPADYDLVIVGSPVWGRAPAAPVRSYLRQHAHELRDVALFCTTRARGAWETLRGMAALCGHEPVAVLFATDAEIAGARHHVDLERFIDCVHDLMNATMPIYEEAPGPAALPALAAASAA